MSFAEIRVYCQSTCDRSPDRSEPGDRLTPAVRRVPLHRAEPAQVFPPK
jgi:hypothetical protein